MDARSLAALALRDDRRTAGEAKRRTGDGCWLRTTIGAALCFFFFSCNLEGIPARTLPAMFGLSGSVSQFYGAGFFLEKGLALA